jgi:hypothetical protein
MGWRPTAFGISGTENCRLGGHLAEVEREVAPGTDAPIL